MLARVYGPVWDHLPQTPQSGEFSSLAAACVNLDGPATLFSDCASVVSVSSRDPVDRLGGQRTHAGSVLQAFSGAGSRIECITKVAARKDRFEAGISQLEAWRRAGNHCADESAKAGARIHPSAEPRVLDDVSRAIRISKAVILLAAKLLPLWPKCNLEGVPYVRPVPKGKGPAAEPHNWSWTGEFWQCQVCLRGRRGEAEPPPGRCVAPPRLNPGLIARNGHQCAVVDCTDGSFLCICRRCGFYSTGGRVVKLGEACVPSKKGAGVTAWNYFVQGRHPQQNKREKNVKFLPSPWSV